MKEINIRLKKGAVGGLLYVSKKINDTSYESLAVAIVNEECSKKLEKLQGDYSKKPGVIV